MRKFYLRFYLIVNRTEAIYPRNWREQFGVTNGVSRGDRVRCCKLSGDSLESGKQIQSYSLELRKHIERLRKHIEKVQKYLIRGKLQTLINTRGLTQYKPIHQA